MLYCTRLDNSIFVSYYAYYAGGSSIAYYLK